MKAGGRKLNPLKQIGRSGGNRRSMKVFIESKGGLSVRENTSHEWKIISA
jgi:hypothetical protein